MIVSIRGGISQRYDALTEALHILSEGVAKLADDIELLAHYLRRR